MGMAELGHAEVPTRGSAWLQIIVLVIGLEHDVLQLAI